MKKERIKITHEGILPIGNIKIPCYVTQDKKRVLSGRGVQNILNLTSSSDSQEAGSRLKRLMNQKAIKPFIDSKIESGQIETLICYKGKTKINGFDAPSLVDLCDAMNYNNKLNSVRHRRL